MGGSGKGLLFSFVRQFRKVIDFDGKNFKFDGSFLYQNVTVDTDIIYIDDVPDRWKFENLFSVLTGSLMVEPKNKKKIIIPFEKSPKFFITSNFWVGGLDMSSIRRKYQFAIVKYFGEDLEPIDEFKRQFFTGWDASEWRKFDNFIAYCCQLYLSETNHKSIGNITDNGIERALRTNTDFSFIDYMDKQLNHLFFDFAPDSLKVFSGEINGVFTTNGVDYNRWKNNMISREPDRDLFIIIDRDKLTAKICELTKLKLLKSTKVTRWLKKWAKNRNVLLNTRYGSDKIIIVLDMPSGIKDETIYPEWVTENQDTLPK